MEKHQIISEVNTKFILCIFTLRSRKRGAQGPTGGPQPISASVNGNGRDTNLMHIYTYKVARCLNCALL